MAVCRFAQGSGVDVRYAARCTKMYSWLMRGVGYATPNPQLCFDCDNIELLDLSAS